MKRMSFGDELLQFAKTVDILDERLFLEAICKIMKQYGKISKKYE